MKTSPNAAAQASTGSHLGRYGPLFASYLFFGVLHEASHVAIASVLLTLRSTPFETIDGLGRFLARAAIGRYCLLEVVDDDGGPPAASRLAIRHFGWIFSLVLAAGLHYWHAVRRRRASSDAKPWLAWLCEPAVILAAYATALEAITTDLLGFAPSAALHQVRNMVSCAATVCCAL